MTKRQLVAQVSTDDLKQLADAAEKGATSKNYKPGEVRKIKRTIALVRKVKAA